MWLSELRLVLADRVVERGALRLQDGLIAEIIEGDAPNSAIDGRGLTALPGLIDLHGDMLEREIEPRPGAPFPVSLALLELDKRLAATGITTAYAALSFAWNEDDQMRSDTKTREIIDTVNAMRDRLLVDTYVHARFEVTNPAVGGLLNELLDAGKIHLFSIMDHTPGQGQYKDVDKYVEFIAKWLGIQPGDIDPELLKEKILARVDNQQRRQWSWQVVEEAMKIARDRHVPVASHDDDTPEKVARLAGMGMVMSEFPVSLAAAQAAHQHGLMTIMGAPNALRGYSHSGNLSVQDAIKAGVVDILATDYYPATLLHAPYEIAARGLLPLHEAIKLVTSNAAKAVNLPDRGALEVGKRADIVLLSEQPHRRVHGTLRGGQPIFWDNEMARRSHMALTIRS